MRLPKEHPTHFGALCELLKDSYGTVEGSVTWYRECRKQMIEAVGATPSKFDESLCYIVTGKELAAMITVVVDDFVIMATSEYMPKLEAKLKHLNRKRPSCRTGRQQYVSELLLTSSGKVASKVKQIRLRKALVKKHAKKRR